MKFNGISSMTVFLAKRETNVDYFFCNHFGEIAEKVNGVCGKHCKSYQPRNKKSGVCKHNGYTYEQTDQKLTINLSDEELWGEDVK
jgi:hypothetical protein